MLRRVQIARISEYRQIGKEPELTSTGDVITTVRQNPDAIGYASLASIKDSVKATYRPEVLGDLGGFGGLFALNSGKYKEPVLVSGTDGVGT